MDRMTFPILGYCGVTLANYADTNAHKWDYFEETKTSAFPKEWHV